MTILRKVFIADEISGKTAGVRPLDPSDQQGAINIHDLDNHRRILVANFIQRDSITDTLGAIATSGDTSITVTNGAQFSVGEEIILNEGNIYETGTLFITAIATNVLTLDRQLDSSYTTSADVEVVTSNMNVVGTLASPEIFSLIPPPGGDQAIWHVDRLLISATDSGAMDDSRFVSLTALTNGVVLREKKASNFTVNNWKTNSDFRLSFYDLNYSDKAGGGLNGLSCRYTFKRVDTIVEVNGEASEEFQILIQDDLSALSSFKITAQGHFARL